ncbi:hypothetical protein [Dyella japonica]|uniref:Uncharacterized protein n=1 Tax=Dyella japonica TaxID=231455 RepID=A0ABV2JP10_9GAMM
MGIRSLFIFLLFPPPIVAIVVVIEGWYLQRHRAQRYDWRAYFAWLADLAGRIAVGRVLGTRLAGVVLVATYCHRATNIGMNYLDEKGL